MPGKPHQSASPAPSLPPISLEVRFLSAVLESVEWVGPPGTESCLACGSAHGTGHAPGCPVARALWPERDPDHLDEAIGEAVFLAASLSHSIRIPLDALAREIDDFEALATRILSLMPLP